jgi:hypothetical protein
MRAPARATVQRCRALGTAARHLAAPARSPAAARSGTVARHHATPARGPTAARRGHAGPGARQQRAVSRLCALTRLGGASAAQRFATTVTRSPGCWRPLHGPLRPGTAMASERPRRCCGCRCVRDKEKLHVSYLQFLASDKFFHLFFFSPISILRAVLITC